MEHDDIVKAAEACRASNQSLVARGRNGGFYCRTTDEKRYIITQEGASISFDESMWRCASKAAQHGEKLNRHDVELCANQDFGDYFRHLNPLELNINLKPRQR